MTPGARAAASTELLQIIDSGTTEPADRLIGGWFRRRRYAGGGDRAAISRVVYTVLRRRAQIDWWLARAGCPVEARSRVLAALLLGERWNAAELAVAFDGGTYRPPPLAGCESELAERLSGQEFDHADQPRPVRGNYPEWLDAPLEAALGDALEAEVAALGGEAPVDLRVNTLRGGRDEAVSALAADGIAAAPTPLSPVGLRLEKRTPLAGTRAFKDGLVELQDEASQIVALMTDARPGQRVADYCAGAGGKTLALAAAMENSGLLVACDTSRSRLARSAPRLARAGVTIAEQYLLGGPDDSGAGEFDRVLVDAPCTGTGTWRRNPAAKWRIAPADLERAVAEQTSILAAAARLVAPGGRLVYAVCSVLAEEGETIITNFIQMHTVFEPVPAGQIWRKTVGSGFPGADPWLRLLPGRDGTDGFFTAIVRRG